MKKFLLLLAVPAFLLSACNAKDGPAVLYIENNIIPQPQQLLGGTTGQPVLDLKLHAEGKNVNVERLSFTAVGPSADGTTDSVQSLAIYLTGSLLATNNPIALASRSACPQAMPHTFCAQFPSSILSLSKGSTARLLVKPVINTDTEGAQSMQAAYAQFMVSNLANSIVATVQNTPLLQNNGDSTASGEIIVGRSNAGPNVNIVGSKNKIVLSKITSITNASPDANGTAIPVGTDRAIGQFKFTAAANNNAKNGVNQAQISDLLLSVAAQNVSLGTNSFFIYNKANPTAKKSCSVIAGPPGTVSSSSSSGGPIGDTSSVGIFNATNGLLQVHCASMESGPINTSINPAQNITLVLEADVFDAQVDSTAPSSLDVSLYNVHTYREGTADTFGIHDSHIQWYDRDNGGSFTGQRWADIDLNGGNTIISTRYVGGSPTSSSSAQSSMTSQPSSVWSSSSQMSAQSSVQTTPRVNIMQLHGPITDTVVANQTGVTLMRFEVRASNKPIRLTHMKFRGPAGNTLHSMSNYQLWSDENSDGYVDTIIASNPTISFGILTFFMDGYDMQNGPIKTMEVKGTVNTSFAQSTFQLILGTTNGDIAAEEILSGESLDAGVAVNGNCPSTCGFWVSTADATIYTLRKSGDLYVSKSITPIRNRQLLGGTLENEILRLKLHAEYEAIDVTKLVFTASGANAGTFSTNVQQLELYKAGATTPFAVATPTGCGGAHANSMCANMNNKQLVLQKGSDADVLVRPRLNSDTEGSISGQNITISIDKDASRVSARGLVSSSNLVANDNDTLAEGEVFIGRAWDAGPNMSINGTSHVVTYSKFVSITNANPDADGTAIPTGSNRPIGQYKFSAAMNNNSKNGTNDADIYGIIFNVTATNVLVHSGSFRVYNKANVSIKATCSVVAGGETGNLTVLCTDLIDHPVDTSVDSGEDVTLVLEAAILNPKINAAQLSILKVSLNNFEAKTAAEFSPTGSHIKWFDRDNVTSTQFLWIDYPETTINSTQYAG